MFNLALFVLKIVFLVLLYLFLIFVVMGALRDIPAEPQGEERRSRVRAHLVVRLGSTASDRDRYRVQDNFSIGRAPDNDIVLADSFASQHHVKILATGEGFVLQDLESTNGTLLDGRRVDELMPLRDGATIQIGKASIVYEEE